ncbi:sulfotransferase [Rubritalea tangerina]|uniref:Sulfotransferase n=1 Tax=Rubritalea tangerina TaxID=430798 RepID=A0ABW4ZCC3_9BACT
MKSESVSIFKLFNRGKGGNVEEGFDCGKVGEPDSELCDTAKQKGSVTKVFCIGNNKTGTTSIESLLRRLGYKMPDQGEQELKVVEAVQQGDFQPLKELCDNYQAFQDLPFSQGEVYANVDSLYPGSKFILTVRDPDAWYDSLVRFHLNTILKAVGVSDVADVVEDTFKDKNLYIRENYLYNVAKRHVAAVSDGEVLYEWSKLYDKNNRVSEYISRNERIIKYFQDRKNQLLVIDLTKEEDDSKLLRFLGCEGEKSSSVPHLNSSKC